MPTTRTIAPGDNLFRIAASAGFTAERIWNDPANAALRAARGSIEALAAGDQIVIPDPKPKEFVFQPGKPYVVRRRGTAAEATLRLLDGDRPRAQQPYRAMIGGALRTGTTADDGTIRLRIPVSAAEGELLLPGDLRAKLRFEPRASAQPAAVSVRTPPWPEMARIVSSLRGVDPEKLPEAGDRPDSEFRKTLAALLAARAAALPLLDAAVAEEYLAGRLVVRQANLLPANVLELMGKQMVEPSSPALAGPGVDGGAILDGRLEFGFAFLDRLRDAITAMVAKLCAAGAKLSLDDAAAQWLWERLVSGAGPIEIQVPPGPQRDAILALFALLLLTPDEQRTARTLLWELYKYRQVFAAGWNVLLARPGNAAAGYVPQRAPENASATEMMAKAAMGTPGNAARPPKEASINLANGFPVADLQACTRATIELEGKPYTLPAGCAFVLNFVPEPDSNRLVWAGEVNGAPRHPTLDTSETALLHELVHGLHMNQGWHRGAGNRALIDRAGLGAEAAALAEWGAAPDEELVTVCGEPPHCAGLTENAYRAALHLASKRLRTRMVMLQPLAQHPMAEILEYFVPSAVEAAVGVAVV